MPYPNKDEFSELLDSRDHTKIVEELLIAGFPLHSGIHLLTTIRFARLLVLLYTSLLTL